MTARTMKIVVSRTIPVLIYLVGLAAIATPLMLTARTIWSSSDTSPTSEIVGYSMREATPETQKRGI